MDDESLAQFQAITGASTEKAQQYFTICEGDLERAIDLFLNTGGVDLLNETHAAPAPTHSQTRPPAGDETRPINIDSDEDDVGSDAGQAEARTSGEAHQAGAHSVEDDEALARRLQEEAYGSAGGGAVNQDVDADGYRAPIARTTETLVGGPGQYDYNDAGDMQSAVLQQVRMREHARRQRAFRGRPGVFNQVAGASSIWNEEASSSDAHQSALAEATRGASQSSIKANQLAEMYRPPFELMSPLSWEEARSEGKESLKWILVNVQDSSIFDCQILNRDLWKHAEIKETIKESFIFMQYAQDDPSGDKYMQYYFQQRENQHLYPHIAIVDPRTGEQMKVWSGPPPPKPMEFLMQLHEFLDRYSLDAKARNPVARRKPAEKKEKQFEAMSEEEQLEWALKNSVENGGAGAGGPKDNDPDDLTRSVGNLMEGRAPADTDMMDAEDNTATNGRGSKLAGIALDKPHEEPAADVPATRIQFRHPGGRVIRKFALADRVRRIYEWLAASPLDGKEGASFELVSMGKNLLKQLDCTVEEAGLKNGTVMIEFVED